MKDNVTILRDMWIELHRVCAVFPEKPTSGDIREFEKFLKRWESRFPDTCPCYQEWVEAQSIEPIPLSAGQSEVFWWSIALHDRINVLLRRRPYAWEYTQNHPLLLGLTPHPDSVKKRRSTVTKADGAVKKLRNTRTRKR